MPPRDSDGFTEDELVQIIPLRRRAPESEKPSGRPAEASGVFDPPMDPEPLAGYSFWERPAAELIRRGEPEPPRSAAKIASALRASGLSPQLWLLSAAALSVVAIVAVLALTLGCKSSQGTWVEPVGANDGPHGCCADPAPPSMGPISIARMTGSWTPSYVQTTTTRPWVPAGVCGSSCAAPLRLALERTR